MMWGDQPAASVEGGQYMSMDSTGGCPAHAYICYLGTTGMSQLTSPLHSLDVMALPPR